MFPLSVILLHLGAFLTYTTALEVPDAKTGCVGFSVNEVYITIADSYSNGY